MKENHTNKIQQTKREIQEKLSQKETEYNKLK